MKARKNSGGGTNVHAELYHRTKLEALRAEGERLRRELRQRGVDPSAILTQARQARQMQMQVQTHH
jgi:hypothetical protein